MTIASLELAPPSRSAGVPERVRVQQIIRRVFYDDQARALCISAAESHQTARALNGDHVGTFQISYEWHHSPGESWASFKTRESNPWVNALHARRIYLDALRRFGNGWRPWSTRGLCGA